LAGEGGQFQYFYELEIFDGEETGYILTPDGAWQAGKGACKEKSTLTVYLKNIGGAAIAGLQMELLEQIKDINGRDLAAAKAAAGVSDETGRVQIIFTPDPRKTYALKIFDKNKNIGDFLFLNAAKLACAENKELTQNLPALSIVIRDGFGEPVRNRKFSLYTEKIDVDGKPYAEKSGLVSAALSTGADGRALAYLAPDHPYREDKKGVYLLSIPAEKNAFILSDIKIKPDADSAIEYILSDLVLEIKNAGSNALPGVSVELFEQGKSLSGGAILGKSLKTFKADQNGLLRIEQPEGKFAAAIKDDLGQKNIIYNIAIKNKKRTKKTIILNLTRVYAEGASGKEKKSDSISIYTLKDYGGGAFYKDKKLKQAKMLASGYAEASLSPGPYLFAFSQGKKEYGAVAYAENGKLQIVRIKVSTDAETTAGRKYAVAKPAGAVSMAERLKGLILLQVEDKGQAWYVDPVSLKRYYLKDGSAAYSLMRRFGLGASSANLKKLTIGFSDKLDEFDYDGDYIPDSTEAAIGTDARKRDTDGDGFADGDEIKNGHDPLSRDKLPIDKNLEKQLAGRLLLQVEKNGEAWYLNPRDQKRYYMPNGEAAYQIMRYFSLGVKDEDLEQIEEGR
jgi:hypothetical protein